MLVGNFRVMDEKMVVAVKTLDHSLRRRDNRRAELLDAAAQNFRLRGYAAASMREIAFDARMKAGSMYYYFPSKVELLIAVHEEGVKRIRRAVETAIEVYSNPWERLEAAMAAHLQVLLDGGDYARVVIRELPLHENSIRDRLVPLRDEYEEFFAELFDDLPIVEGISRRYMRLLVLGALNWTQTWFDPGGDSPAQIARVFLNMLKPLGNKLET